MSQGCISFLLTLLTEDTDLGSYHNTEVFFRLIYPVLNNHIAFRIINMIFHPPTKLIRDSTLPSADKESKPMQQQF